MKLSFMGALFLVFLTLKLCEVITWSWWLVTLPLWGGLALGVGFMGFATVGTLLLFGVAAVWDLAAGRGINGKAKWRVKRKK